MNFYYCRSSAAIVSRLGLISQMNFYYCRYKNREFRDIAD